jgi:acetyl esterase
MSTEIQLEPDAQAFAMAVSKPPFLFELGPAKGRIALDEAQSIAVDKLDVDIEDLTIKDGPVEHVVVRIVRPKQLSTPPTPLPVIVYIHGAGWVFGNEHTHDRLIRELAVGVGAAVVFPKYDLSPEAKYPTAIEECYSTLQWVAEQGKGHGLDAARLAIAGDSVGGNMAAAVTLMAKERGGPPIQRQVLFYPVTDAAFDTPSYHQFAEGYHLRRDAMQWFWDQYTANPGERNEITASPLRASIEQLRGLPPALVITAEADVLRDEGEAYAAKLRAAGVCVTAVRFLGTLHDFVMLNALANTAAARGAIALATAWLRAGFATDSTEISLSAGRYTRLEK